MSPRIPRQEWLSDEGFYLHCAEQLARRERAARIRRLISWPVRVLTAIFNPVAR
jgi:hypothetical protein